MWPMQESFMSSLRLTVRRAVRPLALALAAGSLAALAGCVVAPVAPVAPGPYVVPPGVAYVAPAYPMPGVGFVWQRSEEHTSELQSQSNLVCRLLLEKK